MGTSFADGGRRLARWTSAADRYSRVAQRNVCPPSKAVNGPAAARRRRHAVRHNFGEVVAKTARWSVRRRACHAATTGDRKGYGWRRPRRSSPGRYGGTGGSCGSPARWRSSSGLLFGVPWWTLIVAGAQWPTPVVIAGTVVFVGALVALPVLMVLGHGRRHLDWAAATGDTVLGVIWVLFAWAVLGNVLDLALLAGGVADPARSRIVAGSVAAVVAVLVPWGVVEAMRVPRIKRVDVVVPRLGPGLDGTTGGPDHRHALRPDQPGEVVSRRGRRGQPARRGHRLPHRRHRRRDGGPAARAGRPAGSGPGEAGPGVRNRQPRVLRRGRGLAGPHAPARLGAAAQPAHRRGARRRPAGGGRSRRPYGRVVRPTGAPGRPRGRARRRGPRPAGAAARPPAEADHRRGRRTASTCRSPVTPTAGRSGRSTTSCGSTSRWCAG